MMNNLPHLDLLFLTRKMHSTVFVVIILILIELISDVHAGNATVIASSAVGIVFLVSEDEERIEIFFNGF